VVLMETPQRAGRRSRRSKAFLHRRDLSSVCWLSCVLVVTANLTATTRKHSGTVSGAALGQSDQKGRDYISEMLHKLGDRVPERLLVILGG
jgi:hypothetical protein